MKPAGLDVLVVATGRGGDSIPLIAIAQSLCDRGHRVRLVGREGQLSLVTSDRVHRIADDRPLPEKYRAGSRSGVFGAVRHSRFYQGFARRSVRAKALLRPMEWLYGVIERERRSGLHLVVARESYLGARLACEKLGVPLATIMLQPAAIRSEYDAPGLPFAGSGQSRARRLIRRLVWRGIDAFHDLTITPTLNRFRAELGLKALRRPYRGWIYSPSLVIGTFPSWFANPQPDWPRQLRLTGFPLSDRRETVSLPDGLDAFLNAGEPPIVITRGSQAPGSLAFFRTSIAICQKLGRRGLLLAGYAESIPPNLPADFRHYEYAPFSAILPRAAAIVHHGGVGTIGLAFAAGIPQLAVPLFDDQYDNAARMERLGVGFRVSSKDYAGDCVASKLGELLRSPEVARSCKEVAQRMHSEDSMGETCRLIEELGVRS